MTSVNIFRHLLTALLILQGLAATGQSKGPNKPEPHIWHSDSSGGFTYRYVTHDPAKTRFYTLKNGLTVILSQNLKEPNIVFRMAVRAGSNTDPRTNTGLAHYLEHLLFKGTDHYGTLNYQKEKPLLDKIESLFESYRQIDAKDTFKRNLIYRQIDSTSLEASRYSIANEYDKIMQTIGSTSTNAYTSQEKTIYIEDLPSSAIDPFLQLQSERFRAPVFRNFHTELEVVYEEKNRWLDDDRNQMYQKTLQALFPTHNYGQQTTIGTIEDLKNPSLLEIKKYYQQYYVPNNMAIIMAGDFEYDSLIGKINHYFGYMQQKPLLLYKPAPEAPLTKPQVIDIYGPSNQNLFVSYRGFAQNTRESLLLRLISDILSNGEAGLMDVNINQKQRMLGAGASYAQLKDYGIFSLTGSPREGQTLAEAQKILLSQIELLKKGDFDADLIQAIIENRKLTELKAADNNDDRAENLADAFTLNKGKAWDKKLSTIDIMSQITIKEIVAFARSFFQDNYVAVLKHKGENSNTAKVSKPQMTPIQTNSLQTSEFAKKIMNEPVGSIAPKFLDYTKDLHFSKAGPAEVITVHNNENELFRMSYRFDFGSDNNKLLPFATEYLAFLSTDQYSLQAINSMFYKIACSYDISVRQEETVISIGGLQENFDKAVSLLEHILSHSVVDSQALSDLKQRILTRRENAKLNKSLILSGITSYAQFGPENPFNYVLTSEQVRALKAEDLINILHNLTSYSHKITYYGPLDAPQFSAALTKLHKMPTRFLNAPEKKYFTYTKISSPRVYFANYPMVQTEIYWVRNTTAYNPESAATISLFNNYFGEGMGSLVSQKIRESSALAYSTYAMAWVPDSPEKQTTLFAYVGTQADKMHEAIASMDSLLTELPLSESAFALSKSSIINGLETSRITKDAMMRAYFSDKKLGLSVDSRKLEYNTIQKLRLNDIIQYYKQNIAGFPYNYCIIGDKKNVNETSLKNLGQVTELSLNQIFGY